MRLMRDSRSRARPDQHADCTVQIAVSTDDRGSQGFRLSVFRSLGKVTESLLRVTNASLDGTPILCG